eukprot:scaffold19_cov114-Cylindrotheca_fusiformis.AAC.43
MGIFQKRNADIVGSGSSSSLLEDATEYMQMIDLEEESTRKQILALTTFLALILLLRFWSGSRMKMLSGEHVLSITALNDATLFQEVFLAYLNAALLEPILAIGGMEQVKGSELAINFLTGAAICWWIWLLTDAFDFTDVMQFYKYNVDFRDEAEADKKKFSFLRFTKKEDDALSERQSLVGTIKKDVALWFMLMCIGAAWLPGIAVSHRDALHAYAVVGLWSIMHHTARRATTWSAGYFITFLFPSTALMPLEYCLPLMDVADTVEDLDFLVEYRGFVKERTGVELIIQS